MKTYSAPRFQLAELLLQGFELSTPTSENGLVPWVNRCGDELADGYNGAYYRHELNLPPAITASRPVTAKPSSEPLVVPLPINHSTNVVICRYPASLRYLDGV